MYVPISSGLSGRGLRQTTISSSISKLGNGLTTKSISSFIIQFKFNGFSIVTITVWVFVLKGLGSLLLVCIDPNSSKYVNSIFNLVRSWEIPEIGLVVSKSIISEVSKLSKPN